MSFADSYQKCQVVKLVFDKSDTLVECVNLRTKHTIRVSIKRVKERPFQKGNIVTVRNRPYKRFKDMETDFKQSDLIIGGEEIN